jgi:glyoxylase-like metal-dependent hydrolase (beta-lactamase superfamily II)
VSYRIDLVQVGHSQVRGPEVFWMDCWEDWLTLAFYVVVVRGGGHTLLINAGIPEDLSELNRLWTAYIKDQRGAMVADEPLAAGLRRLGVGPGEVTHVVLSPFQAYSVSGVAAFGGAQICVNRSGWIDFHAPRFLAGHVESRDLAIPPHILIHLVTEAWPRLRLLEDEDEILPGLTCFRAGVHHVESLAISIPTALGKVLWSDCAFADENVADNRQLGISSSLDECRVSYARIRREADVVMPAFEPRLAQRYREGIAEK